MRALGRLCTIVLCWLFVINGGYASPVNIATQHNDSSRTGANTLETVLTPATVQDAAFGRLNTIPINGRAYAQILYLANVAIPGYGTRNYAYVGTMANQLYAFDADLNMDSADPVWQVALGTPVSLPCNNIPTVYRPIGTQIGVMSTPVVDIATNTLYVVSKQILSGSCADPNNKAVVTFTLWAINALTGVVLNSTNISGSASGITFNPAVQMQRPALLLAADSNGIKYIHIAFGTLGDDEGGYRGWVFIYAASTLQQNSSYVTTKTDYSQIDKSKLVDGQAVCPSPNNAPVQNIVPTWANSGGAGGIWQAGSGPVGLSGDSIFEIGNGYSDLGNGSTSTNSAGSSFVRVTPAGTLRDWFTPSNFCRLGFNDWDVGSSGPILVPGGSSGLIIGGGKEAKLFVLDPANMGQYNAAGDKVLQEIQACDAPTLPYGGTYHHIHGAPIYWSDPNGTATSGLVYVWCEQDHLKAFRFNSATKQFEQPSPNPPTPPPPPTVTLPYYEGTVSAPIFNAYTDAGAATFTTPSTDSSRTTNNNYTASTSSGSIDITISNLPLCSSKEQPIPCNAPYPGEGVTDNSNGTIIPQYTTVKSVSGTTVEISNPAMATSSSAPLTFYGNNGSMPGGMLSLSANGSGPGSEGVLWATLPLSADGSSNTVKGVLRAFDASNIQTQLWTSEDVPGQDTLGDFAKFNPPSVSNGKVYVPSFDGPDSPSQLNVYGLASSEVEYLKRPNPAGWIASIPSSAVKTLGTPSSITNGTSINVYARDKTGHLQDFYESSEAGPWYVYDLTNAAASGTGLPIAGNPSAMFYGTSVNVFARRQGFSSPGGQSLLLYWNSGSGWVMTNISTYYNLPNIAGDPVAVVSGSDVYVYARASNDELLEFHKQPNPAPWTVNHTGIVVKGSPYALTANGAIHVLVRANCHSGTATGLFDCDLLDVQRGATQNIINLSQQSTGGIRIIGDASATLNGQRIDVFARASASGMLVDFENTSGAWITVQTGATNVVIGRPFAALLSGSYHVYARDSNNHVIEYYSADGASWQAYDQTQATLPTSDFSGVYLNGNVHLYMSGG